MVYPLQFRPGTLLTLRLLIYTLFLCILLITQSGEVGCGLHGFNQYTSEINLQDYYKVQKVYMLYLVLTFYSLFYSKSGYTLYSAKQINLKIQTADCSKITLYTSEIRFKTIDTLICERSDYTLYKFKQINLMMQTVGCSVHSRNNSRQVPRS